MGFKQYGVEPTSIRNLDQFFGDPKPAYIPLADVGYGNPEQYVVMPQALPPQSMVFPNLAWSINAWPSPHVIYDNRRNGVAF